MAGPLGESARLRDLLFASEGACRSATAAPDASAAASAAQTALLQLHSLLSVTAAAPVSRHHAEPLLQQCTARLHRLSVQRSRSDARRERVSQLLKEAGCPEGFRFGNREGFDLVARLQEGGEPFKALLAPPLPHRRLPPPPQQQQQQQQRPPSGVLTEQPGNVGPAGQRRSGFQVPAKPSYPAGAADAFRRQPPPPQQQMPQAPALAPPRTRPAQDSRWAAKVPRRAHDPHVHASRHSGGESGGGSSSGDEDDGGGQAGGRSIPGFQTAKTKLISDLQQKGQQYQPSQPPRQGLARPAGARPPGLRKTGGGGGGQGGGAAAGAGAGKFVPPYVRKALEAQGGEGEAEGPLSARALEILRLAPGEPLPEALAKLDPQLIENVCSEVMDSGGQLDWSDIAGQQTAKDLIQEVVVWPIKNPQLFTGARAPPKGILLFGPPGTGKTMLGKAIATNISAVFFSISASSLVSKWMGEGERLVRALFAVAAHVAPSVIFIDEVDSLLSARKSDGEHESMRRLKTEILVQMEGIDPSRADRRVLLIGATNRPEELDEAARRRMPKQLYIPLPDGDARQDLILRQLGPGGPIRAQLGEEDLRKVVARTQGYSGSDMKMLIQEACQGPVRDAFKASGAQLDAVTADALRPVVLRDFQMAARAQKASVEPAEIERYEAYNEKHGAKLATAGEVEAEMDEW